MDLAGLGHDDTGSLGLFDEGGELLGVGVVDRTVDGDLPGVEELLVEGQVGAVLARSTAKVVVVGVHPVEGEHLLAGKDVVLVDDELALDVLGGDAVHAEVQVILDQVPQRHASAVIGGVVAGVAVAAHGAEVAAVAGAVVQGVDERTELVVVLDVAHGLAVAQQALLDAEVVVQSVVPHHGVVVVHARDDVLEVGVAGVAAAVVTVKVVGVVRNGVRELLPSANLVLAGSALNLGAVGELGHLGGVVGLDLVPIVAELGEILVAGERHRLAAEGHVGEVLIVIGVRVGRAHASCQHQSCQGNCEQGPQLGVNHVLAPLLSSLRLVDQGLKAAHVFFRLRKWAEAGIA